MAELKKYYLNGIGIISPQRTFDNHEFLPEVVGYDQNVLSCVVPDFKQYIPPNQIRRLSKMLRVGLSAAAICVEDSGGVKPDGIITATGYGLLNDTERFLQEMLTQNEKHLTPTFFMQSTYNAMSGMIGLSMKCTGYNNTYVSRGFAFEMALHDAMMQLSDKPSQTILVGGFDEVNEVHYKVHSRAGYFKKEFINSLELFSHPEPGSLQGEGAAIYSVSGVANEHTWCSLEGLKMIFHPPDASALKCDLLEFLNIHQVAGDEIDLLILGQSGDPVNDYLLLEAASVLGEIPRARFKHLSGEYCTASSFGLWLGASSLKKQIVPPVVRTGPAQHFPVRTVLIMNQYMGKNYSLMLLKQA
jgi:hypothetical protein